MTLLEIDDLHAGYGGAAIVHGVSLAVEGGDTVALLGRNGAGKTTLLRAVFGLAERYHGAVRVDSTPVRTGRPADLARRGLALVPDDRGVFPRLSVAENLRLGRMLAAPARGRLDPLDVFPELRGRSTQTAGTLSGGLQQQLAIARALSSSPRLLAVDELSHGIQPSVVSKLADGLRWASQVLGTALIVVDQNPSLALRICDRAVIMNQGRIALQAMSERLVGGDVAYEDLLVI